jgi:hypothetical protein
MTAETSCRGFVDAVRNRTVSGWVHDPRQPGRRLQVAFTVNGSFAGTGVANRYRADVAQHGIHDGCYGFEFTVPDHCADIYSIAVTVPNADYRLAFSSENSICPISNRTLPPAWKAVQGHFRLPSFFILGAAKSGTTSLHGYLDQHPEICLSNPKEAFYFEAEYDRGATFLFNKYFSHWSGQQLVGGARHRDLYLPYVPPRIHSFNPSAKLIVILRNPVSRAVSHWWHWYSRGSEQLPLKDSLLADLERIESGKLLQELAEIETYSSTLEADGKGCYRTYLDSGYYDEQLSRYIELFGQDQLRIVLLEDLANNPKQTTAMLLNFLGADPRYAQDIDYGVLNQSVPGMQDHLDEETEAWLIGHYKPHNQNLERLLKRSLDAWDEPVFRTTAKTSVQVSRPGSVGGRSPSSLYLDLLKKSVLGELYLENEIRLIYLRACLAGGESFTRESFFHIETAKPHVLERFRRLSESGRLIDNSVENVGFRHTMIGRKRLDNLEYCLQQILHDDIPGDLIECGVLRGGAVIFMRGYLVAHGVTGRAVWVADSFEGLPRPSLPQDQDLQLSADVCPMLAVDLATVRNLFERYGLLDEQVRFLPGWFKDTLPSAPINNLSLLRLDGDLYESTIDALESLYDKVSVGGFIIVDDYGALPQCRQAVTDFRARRGIEDAIEPIDWTGVYWRKV